MSKITSLVFGAALALSPAIVCAQTNPSNNTDQNNNSTTSSQTTTRSTTTRSNSTNNGTTSSATNGQATSPAANNATTANRSMPNTAAGWLPMLLSGGFLSGAGISLRRLVRK